MATERLRRAAFRRTTLAAGLVAVAVLVPTVAWYVSGSRDVSRQARTLAYEALRESQDRLDAGANRLATRLDELLRRESSRPFYQYQSLYHDPRGVAQGLAVIRSPLAQGTADPLVWVHFQIDADGRVSLPTVNERFPELSSDEGLAEFCDVLAELQNGLVVAQEGRDDSPPDDEILVLDRTAWEQIHAADTVYATLTGRRGPESRPPASPKRSSATVVVRVGPLRWHTMVLESGPAIAALRQVVTPDGTLLQGFAVLPAAVGEWLGDHVEFSPTAASGEHAVSVAVAGTGWYLAGDASAAVLRAEREGRRIRTEFLRTFGLGAAAALCAALAVIVIVYQTDRLARQRARFAAAAAHELRTPLATLQLHSEMLADGLGDPEHARSYAERLLPEIRRLGRVVSNMLDLSRLERGLELAQPTAGDLGRAVEDCVGRVRPALERSGLTVGLDIEPGVGEVSFDHDALCQILDNLLDNSDKHTRGQADRRADVTVGLDGDRVTITVADNGPGVPRRVRRRLFEPFGPRSEGSAGLGLGLALARSLARAHGGDLSLAESDGHGARFVLTLPRHRSSE